LVIGAETASSAKSFGVWIWLWGNYTKNEKDHVWTWTFKHFCGGGWH